MMRRGCAVLVVVAGLVPGSAGRMGGAHGQPAPEAGQQAPMPVWSDTAEYCAQLEHRIAAMRVRSAEVRQLMNKGHQLCDHGQARRGIAYMRRALIAQRGGTPD